MTRPELIEWAIAMRRGIMTSPVAAAIIELNKELTIIENAMETLPPSSMDDLVDAIAVQREKGI